MSNIALPIILHKNQQAIYDSPALYKVVKAGKRFGKSKLAVYWLVKKAFTSANRMEWLIAPTYGQAKKIAWMEFKSLIPKQLIRRMVENELQITLANGSVIQLIGADNEDSLRGPHLDDVVFDECALISKYIWPNIIRGQLLGSNGKRPGSAFFISSPNQKGVNWFSDFHAEAERKRITGNKDWDAFHYTIYDNPTLNIEDIEAMHQDSSEDEWQVEYLANESAHAGQIYSEFNYSKHTSENGLDKVDLFIRGIDWGIDHPTVCLFVQVDTKSRKIFIEDEYVQSGYTIEESVDVIKKKTQSRAVDWTVCDPSLNKRNSQTKRTDKQEFDRLGVYCIPGDNNHRGYNITKMFFKKDMIKIHPRCRTLIKQLKELQWTDKENDDGPDVLRYTCVRLHDLVWNGLFDKERKKAEDWKPATFNFNDTVLFKGREAFKSDVMEQINTY